jgi:LPS sulfotransferase NodH
MRKWTIVGLVLIWLAPAVAAAQPGSAECRYLTQQIEHFEGRLERAGQLDNEVWQERLASHVDRLSERRRAQCPGYGDGEAARQAFTQLVDLAARGALSFFTMGAM